MHLMIDDEKMKELIEETLFDMIKEKKEIFYDILLDVIEEIGLTNAIREGKQNKLVSEEKIISILEGK